MAKNNDWTDLPGVGPEPEEPDPVTDEERVAPDVPEEGDSVDTDGDGSDDAIVIDSGGSSSSGSSSGGSTGGSSSPPSKDTIAPNRRPGGPGNPKPVETLNVQELNEAIESAPKVSPQAGRNREVLEANRDIQRTFSSLEDTEQRLRSAEKGSRYKIGEETVTRSEAIDRVESQQQRAEDIQRQNLQNFQQREEAIENRRSAVQKARQRTGIQRPTSIEGIKDTIENPAEQALITGVEGLKYFEGAADTIGNTIPTSQDVQTAQRDVLRSTAELVGADQQKANQFAEFLPSPGLTTASGADNEIAVIGQTLEASLDAEKGELNAFKQGSEILASSSDLVVTEEQEQTTGNLVGGAATGSFILGSFGVATAGATAKALEEDTPTFSEGAVEGVRQTSMDVRDNPTEFISEEVGEEIGEAIVTGGVGAAAVTLTPEFETTPEPSVTDRAIVQGLPGNDALIIDTAEPETPEFVNDPRPQTESETADTTGRNVDVQDISVDINRPELESESSSSNTITSPFIDQSPSLPDSVARPDDLNEFIGQPSVRAEAESVAESTARAETIAESLAEVDVRAELRPESTSRPGSIRTLNPFGGPDRDRGTQDLSLFEGPEVSQEPQRQPSLDAVVLGITSEDTGGDDEFFTGFETRAIEEPSEEEDLNLFF